MAKKQKARYCGIGGQAVLEGVMMKNKDRYAIAVRKPDGDISVEVDSFQASVGNTVLKIPFIRGVFQFIDSLRLGMKSLNFSTSFYEEDEEKGAVEKALDKVTGGKGEKILSGIITLISIALAVGIFIVIPYLITAYFEGFIRNHSLLMVIEGGIRVLIFLLYAAGIGLMKDIRRLYQYHGAEHKCINCIERGRELTVENVMKSSRFHKRCGTSFIFFVLLVSVVLFFFIHVDNLLLRIALRILLMPVVAGISYELISLAGKHDNVIVNILSAPGFLFQKITTKEPDRSMAEVAIASVEAVFDWKAYLYETFGYDVDADETYDEAEEAAPAEEDISTDEAAPAEEDLSTDDTALEPSPLRGRCPEGADEVSTSAEAAPAEEDLSTDGTALEPSPFRGRCPEGADEVSTSAENTPAEEVISTKEGSEA